MDEPTPQAWAKEAWSESQLELLIPVAAGLAVAQFFTALFTMNSSHFVLLLGCLLAVGLAMVRSFVFLYRLSRDSRGGLSTHLTTRDMGWLFLPPILSVLLYGAIAPNYWLGIFFALASLPHFVFLVYLVTRYASAPAHINIPVPTFELIGAPVLLLARALRKTPDFKQP